ncbi:AI-2E family transporter [Halobacteriales archaeon QS_4_66_20]|nr:MAG: AI-2E family transporter [Halobacteriales archaeon QS_4_66_20]
MEINREGERRAVIGLAILALLFVVAYAVVAFIAPVVFAVFLYYAVRPIFCFLDRFGLPRSLRAVLSLVLFGVPFLVLLTYTVAVTAAELESFLQSRGLLESARARIVEELNVAELDAAELETLLSETESLPSVDVLLDVTVTATSAVGSTFFQGVIIVAAVYYMLVDGPPFVDWFLDTFDDDGVLRRYVVEVDSELSETMFGNIATIFVTGIMAILTFYGFNLLVPSTIEVPYPALVGSLVGVATLIPVVGIKLVYVPIVFGLGARAWAAGTPDLLLPVGVLLVVSAVFLDFIPDIFARAQFSGDRTHNGLLILAYLMGPALFGFYGLFLAPIVLIATAEAIQILLPYVVSGTSARPEQTTLGEFPDPGAGETGARDGRRDPAAVPDG